jgi:hypothetical protein
MYAPVHHKIQQENMSTSGIVRQHSSCLVYNHVIVSMYLTKCDVKSERMQEVLVEKEKTFNLVLLISLHRKVSYNEAAEIATQMQYDRLSDFEEAAKRLELVTPPEYRRNFELYRFIYRNWVTGSYDWTINSARYKQTE